MRICDITLNIIVNFLFFAKYSISHFLFVCRSFRRVLVWCEFLFHSFNVVVKYGPPLWVECIKCKLKALFRFILKNEPVKINNPVNAQKMRFWAVWRGLWITIQKVLTKLLTGLCVDCQWYKKFSSFSNLCNWRKCKLLIFRPLCVALISKTFFTCFFCFSFRYLQCRSDKVATCLLNGSLYIAACR